MWQTRLYCSASVAATVKCSKSMAACCFAVAGQTLRIRNVLFVCLSCDLTDTASFSVRVRVCVCVRVGLPVRVTI